MENISAFVLFPYLIGFIFAGLVFGAFCRAVASEKGRSAASWYLLGFFFNLPALVAIAGMPVKENIQWMARNIKDESIFRRCPHCYEYILKGASKCRYCTSAVEPLPLSKN